MNDKHQKLTQSFIEWSMTFEMLKKCVWEVIDEFVDDAKKTEVKE